MRVDEVILPALQLHPGGGGVRVDPQRFMQLLPVAPPLDRLHHDVFCGHKGQLLHHPALYHLVIHHQTGGDVHINVQNGVHRQEGLGHGDSLVGGVVQGALNHWVPAVRPGFRLSQITYRARAQMRSERMGLRL